MPYFSIVFSQFSKALAQFVRVWTKNVIYRKNYREFSTLFLRKMLKMILAEFSQNLRNHALIFCAFGRKRQFIGNFEKIFENFEKIS